MGWSEDKVRGQCVDGQRKLLDRHDEEGKWVRESRSRNPSGHLLYNQRVIGTVNVAIALQVLLSCCMLRTKAKASTTIFMFGNTQRISGKRQVCRWKAGTSVSARQQVLQRKNKKLEKWH